MIAAATRDTSTDSAAFRTCLVQLMRAHDAYGVWAKKPDDEVLERFVLSKEQRRAIPVIGEPDSKVLWRIEVFYTAIGYALTRHTGLDATPILKISDEGFGRALITVGRLVVLSRTLRDVHRFGFESVAALTGAGEAMLAESLVVLDRFPAVARATD